MTTPHDNEALEAVKQPDNEQIAQALIILARSCASITGTKVYKDVCETLYPNCTKEWKI